jgi:RimJ/RimL family protein N-acetyltransferase
MIGNTGADIYGAGRFRRFVAGRMIGASAQVSERKAMQGSGSTTQASREIASDGQRYPVSDRNGMTAMFRTKAPAASGQAGGIVIRIADAGDVDRLSEHFARLSQSSRYNRFLGAVSGFSQIAMDILGHDRKAERFTLIVECREDGRDAIVGEASYGFDRAAVAGEFAISVGDGWQRRGMGTALLCALQWRAVSLGYRRLFGDTLRNNAAMRGLARKAGFESTRSPDWRLVRFDKELCRD